VFLFLTETITGINGNITMFIGKNEDDTDPIYESYDKVFFIYRILFSGIDFLLS
jgi:hypothetical protein